MTVGIGIKEHKVGQRHRMKGTEGCTSANLDQGRFL